MAVGPELSEIVPELFGKDESFSGRSDLWEYLLSLEQNNRLVGSGYESFWLQGSNRVISIYEIFIFRPLQAHNGYIDLLLSTGYVGLALLGMIIINYFLNFFNIKKPHPWVLFIIVVIISNLQESSILRIGQRLNFMFIFSYLILFVNKYKNFSWSKKPDLN
jgi:O-antigen ligase